MLVKFWQTIVRFWFFLDYLITNVKSISKRKLGRNPRSDRDLCEKGNKSKKRNKSPKKIKVLKRNKSPNRKGKIKVQIKIGKSKWT